MSSSDIRESIRYGLEKRGCDPDDEEAWVTEGWEIAGGYDNSDYGGDPEWFAEHLSTYGDREDIASQLWDFVSGREHEFDSVTPSLSPEEIVHDLIAQGGAPYYTIFENNDTWFLLDARLD